MGNRLYSIDSLVIDINIIFIGKLIVLVKFLVNVFGVVIFIDKFLWLFVELM